MLKTTEATIKLALEQKMLKLWEELWSKEKTKKEIT